MSDSIVVKDGTTVLTITELADLVNTVGLPAAAAQLQTNSEALRRKLHRAGYRGRTTVVYEPVQS